MTSQAPSTSVPQSLAASAATSWSLLPALVAATRPPLGEPQVLFQNPVVAQGADPWILRHHDQYIYTCTHGDRIELRVARRLCDLATSPASVIWTPTANGPCSRDIWAPEIHWVEERGRFYIYFTATNDRGFDSQRRVFVLESAGSDPVGPYALKGKVAVPGCDEYAIDGTLLLEGGRMYFLWSGRETSRSGPQNIYIAAMENPWTLCGERVLLSTPQHSWEKHGWDVNEGPMPLRNAQGRLFVVYSGSGFTEAEYCLGLLRHQGGELLDSRNWTKSTEPVFSAYQSPLGDVYGPGHNSFFKSPDGLEDWMIYHARDAFHASAESRSARAQPFRWHENGDPDFGVPLPSGMPVRVPSGE